MTLTECSSSSLAWWPGPFPAQRPLPICAALSDRMEVPTRTFRADWEKIGMRLGVWMQSGGHYSTASRLSWSSTRAAYCWSFSMDQSAGGWPNITSFRKIQCIFWASTISNGDLLARCQQEDMETVITRKRWRLIGHVLRKDANSITIVAIHWTPEGKCKRGKPKTTWWRTVEAELKNMNHSLGTIQSLASDRQGWRSCVAALYTSGRDG